MDARHFADDHEILTTGQIQRRIIAKTLTGIADVCRHHDLARRVHADVAGVLCRSNGVRNGQSAVRWIDEETLQPLDQDLAS